jgi:hypothetical protein
VPLDFAVERIEEVAQRLVALGAVPLGLGD